MKRNLKRFVMLFMAVMLCICPLSCKKKGEDTVIPGNAVAVYGDYYVTEPLYRYWLAKYKYYFLTSYNNGNDTDEFWDSLIDDETTYEKYVTELVYSEVKNRVVALSLFDEYGLTFTETMEQSIDDDINDKMENIGSRKEMNEELAEKFDMNIDMLREVYIVNEKYDMVIEYLYGDSGTEKVSEEEKAQFFSENYYSLKLITLYTDYAPVKDDEGNYVYDENGELELEALTDEEIADKEALLTQIEFELDEGADFEECSDKYSEIDYSSTPHGILVSSADYTSYGSDVINAALELEIGKYRTLRDDVSTLIVMKYPLPAYTELTDLELSTLDGMEDRIESHKKNEKFDTLTADVVLNTDIVNKFSIRDVSRDSYY